MKIQRVLCDYFNNTSEEVLAVSDYNVTSPIVDVAENFVATIETAEVSLTTMPLNVNSKHVMAFGPWEVDDESHFDIPLVYHTLPEVVQSIETFIESLNKVMRNNGKSLGVFSIDKDSRISFRPDANLDNWKDTKVFLNDDLYALLKDFCHYDTTYDRWEDDYDGVRQQFHALKSYQHGKFPLVKQERETVSDLVKFKSVRFMTTLPVRPYMVYKQETDVMELKNILTTVKINSANFDLVNQRNLLYIPNELRSIELCSSSPISSFTISIEIYYATGHIFRHKLAPGEYFEIALAFKEKNTSIV